MAGKNGTISVTINGDAKPFKRAVGESEEAASSFMGKLEVGMGKMGSIFAGVGLSIGQSLMQIPGQVAGYISDAVGQASDLGETVSKNQTIFGEGFASLDEWAKKAPKALGLTRAAALDATGTFGNMFDQLGMTESQVQDLSKANVQLAVDFGSFHNADTLSVMDGITAAYRGEYDAVQRYVPLINAAAVEQKGLEMGLGNTADELDAQEKALIVNTLLMEGAGAAVGDFARTQDSAANKSKSVNAQFEELQTRIGTGLLPIWSGFLSFLDTQFLPAADKVMGWGADLKAAWETGGITGAIDFLKTSFNGIATWFTDEFWPGTLKPKITEVWTATGTWVANEGLSLFTTNAVGFITGVGNWITNDLIPTVVTGFETVTDKFVGWVDGSSGGRSAADELEGKLPTIGDRITGYIQNQLIPNIITANYNMMTAVTAGAVNAVLGMVGTTISTVVTEGPRISSQIFDSVMDGFWNVQSWLYQTGKDMIQGAIDGIWSMAGDIKEAARNVVQSAVDAVKDALIVGSPSRVFMELGMWSGEGFALGLADSEGSVTQAAEDMSYAAVGGVGRPAGQWGGPVQNVNVTVTVPVGADVRATGRELDRVLRRYQRSSGVR